MIWIGAPPPFNGNATARRKTLSKNTYVNFSFAHFVRIPWEFSENKWLMYEYWI